MTAVFSEHSGSVELAAAWRTHPHETRCGDGYLVKRTAAGLLLCVIDGLGHGKEALTATETALTQVSEHAEETLTAIFDRCHSRLRTTRGAVVSLALMDDSLGTLRWAGVGNVEGVLVSSSGRRDWLPLRPGIVGCRMPTIHMSEFAMVPGDVLLMFSDGVKSNCLDRLLTDEASSEMAHRIISEYARGTDDAVILVAKYNSSGSTVD